MNDFIPITDFQDPRLDVYARLTEHQLLNREHPGEGIFLAESPKVITRALDAGYTPISCLTQDHIPPEAHPVLDRLTHIPRFIAPMEVLIQLTGFQLTRGMLCAMRRPPQQPLASLLDGVKRVAVLEDVMNPTNVGAIIRSAAALGMELVLLTPGCADPLYRRAIRVSMGTVFQVPWTYLPAHWQQKLHNAGFQLAAMALSEDSISLRDPCLRSIEKLAVVLGTEGDGLRPCTISGCDYTVRIPMAPGVDSLNVAAASAVAFYQLTTM